MRELENEEISKWGASYKKSASGGIVSLFNFAKGASRTNKNFGKV